MLRCCKENLTKSIQWPTYCASILLSSKKLPKKSIYQKCYRSVEWWSTINRPYNDFRVVTNAQIPQQDRADNDAFSSVEAEQADGQSRNYFMRFDLSITIVAVELEAFLKYWKRQRQRKWKRNRRRCENNLLSIHPFLPF